jgi:uncharacterized protein (DUF1015 family)
MATLKPFAALRPKPELAARICELPYDVLSSEEARAQAAGNPLSFFHVSRPEIDLPPATDVHAPEVYARGRENFQKLIRDGALQADPQPCFYLYRQIMGGHAQTGVVAAVSCEDYLQGIVRKHELTLPDKEDDRVRHIEALDAQTGPASLLYRAVPAVEEFVAGKISGEPAVDFTAGDGVRHTAWMIRSAKEIRFIERAFAQVPSLYIADGHHRSAAAARIFQSRRGAGHCGQFLAVIFPHTRMQIMPYNRVLTNLNGWTPKELPEVLSVAFAIDPHSTARPIQPHEVGLYAGGRWLKLVFRQRYLEARNPAELLDAALLQKHVLDPIFGIADPRTSDRIAFVGGIRGAAELEKLVDSGQYACAFAMFPPATEDMMAIADAGQMMPPKSTWFEPKLRDGMFCHVIS